VRISPQPVKAVPFKNLGFSAAFERQNYCT
jgi:hypothetical protein